MQIINLEQVRQSRSVKENNITVLHPKKRTNAKVYQIITNVFCVHPDRVTDRDVTAPEFFNTLVLEGSVTVISSSLFITPDSLLKVESSEDKKNYTMSVKDFVRITEPSIGHTKKENTHDYVLDSLASVGIRVQFIVGSDSMNNENDFFLEDIEIFTPESIKISWKGSNDRIDYYDCMIDSTQASRGFLILPGAFKEPRETPLLYMLVDIWIDYTVNGYKSDDGGILELRIVEGIDIDTTNIPLEYLETIILNGIIRMNPIYAQIKASSSEVINMFYQRQVIPTLNTVIEYDDEE